jgi:hypothetical protein
MITKPTKAVARKILDVLKHGLVRGKGDPKPGEMCVEAAVCFAMGLPHSDEPPCVGSAVRSFKITLNDSHWSSDMARANGMRRIAIAQLGSNEIDQNVFVKELARLTIKKIVPIALRAAAKIHPEQKHKDAMEAAAVGCEEKGSEDAASAANDAASYAASAASDAASYAASDAASAASYAANAANAASYAASDAANAADAASAAGDEVLCLMAEIGVEVLQVAGSPGCKWLGLCETEAA